jgi:hypothetical protein
MSFEQFLQFILRRKIENSTQRGFPVFPDATELGVVFAEADRKVFSPLIQEPVDIGDIRLPLLGINLCNNSQS